MQLTVNERLHRVAAPQGTLLDLLRDDLALTGTGRISVTQTTGVTSSCDAPD